MDETIKQNIISSSSSIKEGLIKLNSLGINLTLFVVDKNNKLIGSVTDGDIRRALINDIHTDQPITSCMNKSFTSLVENSFGIQDLKKLKQQQKYIVPIVDIEAKILRIINIQDNYSLLPLDALIMAGGRGVRLAPLTDNVPKPLLEVGGVPIIERNIDRLIAYGIDSINISIKYLGQQLIDKFGNGENKKIQISYVEEKEALGTIGAIALVENFVHDDILVMNSDILSNFDLEKMFEHHKASDSDITVASYPYQISVPYAILDVDNEKVNSLKEKPTYTYYSNAGIYIIKKSAIELVPKNSFYNATDLIESIIDSKGKVSHYPILNYWLDIGKHEDFLKAQKDVEYIKF